jgi:hypothetical protein
MGLNVYWMFMRLHRFWFISFNLICFPLLFLGSYILPVLLTKLVGYAAIYLITRPINKRHDYYFRNLAFSMGRLFLIVSLMDLIAFCIIGIPLKLLV